MDKTKAKIQELCPDVMNKKYPHFQDKEFTLAVVLRAIEVIASRSIANIQDGDEAAYEYYHNRERWFWSVVDMWNLEHDNYDQQSEECKQFIGKLLGV